MTEFLISAGLFLLQYNFAPTQRQPWSFLERFGN